MVSFCFYSFPDSFLLFCLIDCDHFHIFSHGLLCMRSQSRLSIWCRRREMSLLRIRTQCARYVPAFHLSSPFFFTDTSSRTRTSRRSGTSRMCGMSPNHGIPRRRRSNNNNCDFKQRPRRTWINVYYLQQLYACSSSALLQLCWVSFICHLLREITRCHLCRMLNSLSSYNYSSSLSCLSSSQSCLKKTSTSSSRFTSQWGKEFFCLYWRSEKLLNSSSAFVNVLY